VKNQKIFCAELEIWEATAFKNKIMGLINNLMDRFKNAEFTVAPQKKLKTLSSDFKKSFNLSLVFYKGVQIAD
jgi:hypothetical protein